MTSTKKSVLVALNDSVSSRAMIDYLCDMTIIRDEWRVTLVHLFKHPSASDGLMGVRFTEDRQKRAERLLQKTKEKLIEYGLKPNNIEVKLVTDPYPTIGEGIIDQFEKDVYDIVMIGRKKMSKAEEFVRGDISIKLVRTLESAAVLVVTSQY